MKLHNQIIFKISTVALMLFMVGCVNNQKQTNTGNVSVTIPTADDVFTQEETVTSAISINEALARAVKSNLTFRDKLTETLAGISTKESVNFNQLQNKIYRDANHTKLIDASNLNCETPEDRSMIIAAEEQRRLTQHLFATVYSAYWNVVALTHVNGKINAIEKEIYDALDYAKVIYGENANLPLEVLQYQRSLWANLYTLQQYKTEYLSAKSKLAILMGLDPKINYSINGSSNYAAPLAITKNDLKKLEITALQSRPEIRQAYCSPALGQEKKSLNLRSLISQPDKPATSIERQLAFARLSSTAFEAISEVNHANISYQQAKSELNVAGQLQQRDRSIVKLASGSAATQLSEHLALINQKMASVNSQRFYELAYAKWHATAADLILAIGYDRIPLINFSQSIDAIAKAISSVKLAP